MTSEIARKWTAVFWKDLIEGPRTLQLQSCIQSAIDEATKEKDKKIERLTKMLRQPEPAADVEALAKDIDNMYGVSQFDSVDGTVLTETVCADKVQSFLTAHDRAKDAEIRRLKDRVNQLRDLSETLTQVAEDVDGIIREDEIEEEMSALQGASDGRID